MSREGLNNFVDVFRVEAAVAGLPDRGKSSKVPLTDAFLCIALIDVADGKFQRIFTVFNHHF